MHLFVRVGCAVEDFLETGQVVWPAAPVLAYFLLSDEGQNLTSGRDVIELGAGVGIPGLLASLCAHSVVLTDHNPTVLEILRRNVALNEPVSTCDAKDRAKDRLGVSRTLCSVSVEPLDWDSPPSPALVGRFDVAIGADVVYAPGAAAALFRTVDAVLAPRADARFLLCHVSRCAARQNCRACSAVHTGSVKQLLFSFHVGFRTAGLRRASRADSPARRAQVAGRR